MQSGAEERSVGVNGVLKREWRYVAARSARNPCSRLRAGARDASRQGTTIGEGAYQRLRERRDLRLDPHDAQGDGRRSAGTEGGASGITIAGIRRALASRGYDLDPASGALLPMPEAA